jgi:glycosyltransferase involved in cell wall biosynthesis
VAQCDDGRHGQWPALRRWRRPADRVIISGATTCGSLGRQPSRDTACTVVPLGVAAARDSAPTRELLLESLHLPADALLVAVAGPLVPRFGVKELIWAGDMVRVLHPNIRLLIVGDGPQRKHLERFAQTAAEPKNVCFLGDTDRWPDIVPHLDVYWQGTEADGVSPTTLLDAMAAAVPVVASATPQHRQIIDDGQTGFLVGIDARAERTRATDLLLVDRDAARSIGAAGRDRVLHHFSLAARAANFQKIYHELLP